MALLAQAPQRYNIAAALALVWGFAWLILFGYGALQRRVLPILAGGLDATLALGQKLSDLGFPLRAIRSPTVPAGQERLRLTLNATQELDHIIALLEALRKTATDAQTQRVFDIATHKVEYVAELLGVKERHLRVRNECLARTRQAMQQVTELRGRPLSVDVNTAALGLHVMIDGLIQNWLLDPQAFDLVATGSQIFDTYLAGLGLQPDQVTGEKAA